MGLAFGEGLIAGVFAASAEGARAEVGLAVVEPVGFVEVAGVVFVGEPAGGLVAGVLAACALAGGLVPGIPVAGSAGFFVPDVVGFAAVALAGAGVAVVSPPTASLAGMVAKALAESRKHPRAIA